MDAWFSSGAQVHISGEPHFVVDWGSLALLAGVLSS